MTSTTLTLQQIDPNFAKLLADNQLTQVRTAKTTRTETHPNSDNQVTRAILTIQITATAENMGITPRMAPPTTPQAPRASW